MSSSPPPLPSPPANILSRSWLRQLTAWIRDDLDILVAREGTDILRADDVLVLHETFAALQYAHNITSLDLRATGIHRAVQDIAGTATRWPSRLCDECDTIKAIWTAKFGSLTNIRPFLFGRGGRLEGIASVTEYSGEALLKRWSMTCPDKIHPSRSHKQGDLGFRAGAWWINPFFAHHAGIIGRESIEGGTTFDRHAAYALLLKDTVDFEAATLENFTYRCSQNDKGRYRLTSATPRSRKPIRVLRSHGMDSIWGPKAGVRYEGLFTVKGWHIQTAKSADTTGGEWKEGEIIFEVNFERTDPIPITEVIKHPTAAELDDYSEYKRLRKARRNEKLQRSTAPSIKSDSQPVIKRSITVKPILPAVPLEAKPVALSSRSPSASKRTVFKKPQFGEHSHTLLSPGLDVVSPKNISAVVDRFNFVEATNNETVVPTKPTTQNEHHDTSARRFRYQNRLISRETSQKGSSQIRDSSEANIRDVAPWIDYEPGLNLPSPDDQLANCEPKISQNSGTNSFQSKKSMKAKNGTALHRTQQVSRDYRKSIFVRKRNSGTKLLDGTRDPEKHLRNSNSSDPVLPTQATLISRTSQKVQIDDPPSSLNVIRRNAVSCPLKGTEMFPKMPAIKASRLTILPRVREADETFFSIPPSRLAPGLPLSLEKLISHTSPAQLVCSTVSPHACATNYSGIRETVPQANLNNMGEDKKIPDIKVAFGDAFGGRRQARRSRSEEISSVAPDFVI